MASLEFTTKWNEISVSLQVVCHYLIICELCFKHSPVIQREFSLGSAQHRHFQHFLWSHNSSIGNFLANKVYMYLYIYCVSDSPFHVFCCSSIPLHTWHRWRSKRFPVRVSDPEQSPLCTDCSGYKDVRLFASRSRRVCLVRASKEETG